MRVLLLVSFRSYARDIWVPNLINIRDLWSNICKCKSCSCAIRSVGYVTCGTGRTHFGPTKPSIVLYCIVL